jgi:hypothetical protein
MVIGWWNRTLSILVIIDILVINEKTGGITENEVANLADG